MPERSVAIRIAVRDVDQARQRLLALGAEGEAALKKIEGGSKPASTGLGAFANSGNQATRSVQTLLSTTLSGVPGLGQFSGHIKAIGAGFGVVQTAALAAVAAIGAGIGIFAASTRAASAYEVGLSTIESVLKATGGASGKTAAQIDALSFSIGKATLASTTEVREAAAQLLTFKSIAGDAFDDTLNLAEDLAALGFGSISSAAVQLGKALEDPATGLASLRRVGVSFSESQQDLIKSLSESGQQLEAQKIILKAVREQVGGAGEAQAGGLAGSVDTLAEKWQHLLETFGDTSFIKTATDALGGLLDKVQSVLSGPTSLDEATGQLRDQLRQKAEGSNTFLGFDLSGGKLDDDIAKSRRLVAELGALGHAQEQQAQFAIAASERVQAETVADHEATEARKDLTKAEKEAAVEAKKRGDELAKEAERRTASIEDLDIQVEQLRRVAAAEAEGAAAARDAEIAIASENAVRKLGADASQAQKLQVAAETVETERLKDTIKELQKARQSEAGDATKLAQEQARALEKAATATERDQERLADQAAKDLARPFENAADNIQNTFTSTFEEIFNGGVKSFSDLFAQARSIATHFAAELATLLVFRPQLLLGGLGGLGGAGQTAASAAGTSGGPSLASTLGFGGFANSINSFGGNLGFSVPAISGVGPPTAGFLGTTASLSQALGAAGLGALGGGVFGSLFGGQGGLGGSLGGGAGAAIGALAGSAFPGVGTLLGGLIGGGIGGLGGGLLGSLFGGGGGSVRLSTTAGGPFAGPFGTTKLGGDNKFQAEFSQILAQFDDEIASHLTARERDLAAQFVQGLPAVDFSHSGLQIEHEGFRIVSDRLRAILDAIPGVSEQTINAVFDGVTKSTANNIEELTRRAGIVLETREQLKQILTPENSTARAFRDALEQLNAQFDDLRDTAEALGLSTTGLTAAQKRAVDDLNASQQAQVGSQLLGIQGQFTSLSDPLRAFRTQLGFSQLSPADQFKSLMDDFNRIAAEAQAGSLTAIGQLTGAGQALLAQAGQFGASPQIAAVTKQIQDVLDKVIGNIDTAQATALTGLNGEIRRASSEQVTTLKDLGTSLREELRQIRRAVNELNRRRAA